MPPPDMTAVCLALTKKNRDLQAALRRHKDELHNARARLLAGLGIAADDQQKRFRHVPLVKLIDIDSIDDLGEESSGLRLGTTDTATATISPSISTPTILPSVRPSLRVRGPKIDNTPPASLRNETPSTSSSSSSTASSSAKSAKSANLATEAGGKRKSSSDGAGLQRRFETTQRRCWKLESEVAKRNGEIAHWKKKCEELAKHTERLMFHLKQETAAKATAQHRSTDFERRLKGARKRIRVVMEERDETKRMMAILKQGAEILEGQLRSLDVRFMQLRGTLDWHTHHARDEIQACSREFVRLSSEIESYKSKWNVAEDKIRTMKFHAKKQAQAFKRRQSQVEAIQKIQDPLPEEEDPLGSTENLDAETFTEHVEKVNDNDAVPTQTTNVKSRADQYQWNYESVTLPDESQPLPEWELSSEAEGIKDEEKGGKREADQETILTNETAAQ